MKPGDVYKTRNENLYLVLPGLREAYIGNCDPTKGHPADTSPLTPPGGAVVVTSLKIIPWKDMNDARQ